MKAIAVTSFGGPEVLQLREFPDPQPGPGQVVIRVAYAGVNFAEIMGRRGDYHNSSLPFIPGLEVSGHIHSLGEGVEGFSIGQSVAALTITGGYAEFVVVSAALTVPLDVNGEGTQQVDLRTAAGFPTIVPTAVALLSEVARIREGESVLIHAAAGGVGIVAAQIARLLHAGPIIGTVSSEDKVEYARSFGYDHVIVREYFASKVMELTGKRGVDVILESIGGRVLMQSMDVLAPLGRLVFMGNASGSNDVPQSSQMLRIKNKGILGFSISRLSQQDPQRATQIMRRALQYVANGQVRIDITEVLPLSQVGEAHRRIESRQSTGKLLLQVHDVGANSIQ
jgi:NADPH:quinone reductase